MAHNRINANPLFVITSVIGGFDICKKLNKEPHIIVAKETLINNCSSLGKISILEDLKTNIINRIPDKEIIRFEIRLII